MATTTRTLARQADSPIQSPTSFYDSPPSLLNIVRRANARYSHIASSMRESLPKTRPSIARKRAALLNLTVNTEAARNLEQRYVSVVPLPIIEVGPSPTTLIDPSSSELLPTNLVIHAPRPKRPVLKCVIPALPRQEQQVSSSVSVSTSAGHAISSAFSDSSFESLESAEPHCSPDCQVPSSTEGEQSSILFAPAALRGQSIPWRPVTSRWSVSTIGEGESDVEMDLAPQVESNHRSLVIDVPVRPMAPLPGARRKHTRSYAVQIDMSSGLNQGNVKCSAEPIHLNVAIGKRKSVHDSEDHDMASPQKGTESPVEKRPKYSCKDWARRSSAFTITYNERGAF
ncbi:hypothetical protein BJ165DRAFT_243563 [Panaeolus papilionaceus]|nr:hypothetical protein BJ165DRAFT_243563 [Panaeolus papilionaceus]